MSRKIVAIGGGENGRQLEDGTFAVYDTESIDKEIVNLTKKKHPNFLFLCHAFASFPETQESYYKTIKKIYGDKFECNCKDLKSDELYNKKIVNEKIKWADIIYEGGGDTLEMINLWKKTEFDKILKKAWEEGKVISGISAGAVCWFNSCNSDCTTNNENVFNTVKCLNWINAFLIPHADEKGRISSSKKQLKKNNLVGIMLSNRSAIEIVDDKYRILLSNYDKSKNTPYVLKAYWKENSYNEKVLINQDEYKKIEELLSKD